MYDVLIVGAGPAGSTAALDLTSSGARVALIDHRTRIGDKLCTGIIGVECADRFPVPPDLVHHRASAALIHSPAGQTYSVEHPSTQALIVDRVAYIDCVAQKATDRGAEHHLGCMARGIDVSDRGASLCVSRGGQERRLHGRAILIATGFGSPLTRMAGLDHASNGDFLLGHQRIVEVTGLEATEVYMGDAYAPSSFGWLVPTSHSQGLLGTISRARSDAGLESLTESLSERGRIRPVQESEIGRWGIPIRPIARTYGDRVLVLGDAAGFAKPTTGGGIYYAMLSGEIAARTLLESLDTGDFSDRALRKYETRWKSEFGDELRIGYYARLLFEQLSDAQIELLMETFLSQDVQQQLINPSDFSFDRHSRTILRTVGHRQIGRIIKGFGPSVAPMLARLLRSTLFH